MNNNDSHQLQVTTIHSGPLPAPEQLAAYENICPGAAERIIKMAEKQIAHRQEMEKFSLKTKARNSLLGMCFGFVIGMSCVISGTLLSLNGLSLAGFGSLLAGLTSLVAVFVYGRKNRKIVK